MVNLLTVSAADLDFPSLQSRLRTWAIAHGGCCNFNGICGNEMDFGHCARGLRPSCQVHHADFGRRAKSTLFAHRDRFFSELRSMASYNCGACKQLMEPRAGGQPPPHRCNTCQTYVHTPVVCEEVRNHGEEGVYYCSARCQLGGAALLGVDDGSDASHDSPRPISESSMRSPSSSKSSTTFASSKPRSWR